LRLGEYYLWKTNLSFNRTKRVNSKVNKQQAKDIAENEFRKSNSDLEILRIEILSGNFTKQEFFKNCTEANLHLYDIFTDSYCKLKYLLNRYSNYWWVAIITKSTACGDCDENAYNFLIDPSSGEIFIKTITPTQKFRYW